jgi:hypothetical protein
MIDWNYVLSIVILILIVLLVITIIKKTIQFIISISVLLILVIGLSTFLVYNDLNGFDENQTFLLEKDGKYVSMVENGKLVNDIPAKFDKRIFVLSSDSFPDLNDNYNFENALKDKFKGDDKSDKRFIFDNAKSVPDSPAYKLSIVAKLLLR